eukprot:scaffold250713_cov55-Attheya_sp.AAC.1
MEPYHFFQIEIEISYFVPFRRPSTKLRTWKAPVGSSGFAEPIERALCMGVVAIVIGIVIVLQ